METTERKEGRIVLQEIIPYEINGVTIVIPSIREIVLSVDLSPTVIRCDLWKQNYLAISG